MKQLILGGARSGKSRLAERLAGDSGMQVHYIATATAEDDAMQRRIEQHRLQRPDSWAVTEEPLWLTEALKLHAADNRCLLVDCLTLWVTNLLLKTDQAEVRRQLEALSDLIPHLPGSLIMVSNEVGMGVVPMGELTRRFQDEIGNLHQSLAGICDRVILTVAGLPQVLKGAPL